MLAVFARSVAWLRSRFGLQPVSHVMVSYPKSGQTWLRLMLGKALADHLELRLPGRDYLLSAEKFWTLDRRAPRIEISHDGSPFLQTREELQRDKSAYAGKSVILLVRDPRDVVISSWYRREKKATRYGQPVENTLSRYVRHPVDGIEKVVEFMNVWAASREVPARLYLVRYEDVIAEPEKRLRGILEFLGLHDVSESVVQAAVEYARFDNMKALERDDTLASTRLRPFKPDDPTTAKVRRGEPGGYRDDLDAEDVAYVDEVVASSLDPWFGY